MKCKNLKIKLNGKIECKLTKKIIDIKQCNNCKYREYKQDSVNSLQTTANTCKAAKSSKKAAKRTKELAIPKKVKLEVWERDNHRCIFCHKLVPWNMANSHYIKRSHSGLGIPKNILTNCEKCHSLFDDSILRKDMLLIAEKHLKSKYNDWNKDDLVYKK